jgi:hypothetical protein
MKREEKEFNTESTEKEKRQRQEGGVKPPLHGVTTRP